MNNSITIDDGEVLDVTNRLRRQHAPNCGCERVDITEDAKFYHKNKQCSQLKNLNPTLIKKIRKCKIYPRREKCRECYDPKPIPNLGSTEIEFVYKGYNVSNVTTGKPKKRKDKIILIDNQPLGHPGRTRRKHGVNCTCEDVLMTKDGWCFHSGLCSALMAIPRYSIFKRQKCVLDPRRDPCKLCYGLDALNVDKWV